MTERFMIKKWGTLFAIFAIFAIPFGAAWYYHRQGGLQRPTTNHGQLIRPLIHMKDLPLRQANGLAYPNKLLFGKWLLLYVIPKECDQLCRNNLHKMRQLHIALNKDMSRVQRMVATLGQATPILRKILREQYQNVSLLSFNKTHFLRMTKGRVWQSRVLHEGGIYIIDPQAHLMMVYRLNQGPKAIHRDLKRLLKVSRVG